MAEMQELLRQFENKAPEIVFEWKDPETEAEGWVVINSLRGGAAGGGTRMRKGLDKNEVVSLAKTMEIKFANCGPSIGGAKSGINFDPSDPRKKGVLDRWFRAVAPLLREYYGTGGDLNIDEVQEVIPITEAYGLMHPQQGILNGHFFPNEQEKNRKILQLRKGVSKEVHSERYTPEPSRKYVIADLITGYGVAESVKHFYDLYGGAIENKKVIIQGWGNVSSAAAFYLAQQGAQIIGIIDSGGGIIQEKGLSFEEVRELFLLKKQNQLPHEYVTPYETVNEQIWDLPADVLIPGAASRLLTTNQLQRLYNAGLELICSGANVPFADQEIFYGPIAQYADKQFCVIPDFIANSGMARVFAFLMQNNIQIADNAIFSDVSNNIREALKTVYQENKSGKNFMETAYRVSLNKII